MKELLEAAFSWVNIIPTSLLIFVLIYWLIVILGLVHVDALDLDVHAAAHAEVDTHSVLLSEVHTDSPHPVAKPAEVAPVSWLDQALSFLNLGKVVFVSFLALPLWVISILANHYLGNESFIISLVLLIPAFIASLFAAKLLTTPLVKAFSYLYNDPEKEAVVGRVCTLLLPASHDRMGQAVIRRNGTVLMLNVKTAEGKQLDKGASALVINFEKGKNYYLIEQLEL
jgi:hypothetical protein